MATLMDQRVRLQGTLAEFSSQLYKSLSTKEDEMLKTTGPMSSKIANPSMSLVPWLETQAEVTGCHQEFARMNTLMLGFAADSNRFLISFTYYAHATTFSGQFTSPVIMEQGKRFPIFYNPLNPQENRQSESGTTLSRVTRRSPLFALGIAGSIVISLLYLAMMYGCN